MKKITFLFGLLLMGLNTVWAVNINFTTNKTQGTTDDTFQIHLSVDGEVDNEQVGIQGLENFKVVGQQSSSQIQVINGTVSSIQEKILSLTPKSAGNFSLTALAKENGKDIQSDTIKIHIKKSLVQKTKEKLLQSSLTETDKKQASPPIEDSSKDLKKLLTTANKNVLNNTKNSPPIEKLSSKPIDKFPKVQHISAFNKIFWLEFLGILLIFLILIFGIKKVLKLK